MVWSLEHLYTSRKSAFCYSGTELECRFSPFVSADVAGSVPVHMTYISAERWPPHYAPLILHRFGNSAISQQWILSILKYYFSRTKWKSTRTNFLPHFGKTDAASPLGDSVYLQILFNLCETSQIFQKSHTTRFALKERGNWLQKRRKIGCR